jgi:myosin heavy subunit
MSRYQIINIQSHIRKFLAQKQYFMHISRIKVIQSLIRNYLFQKSSKVILAQSCVRRYIYMKKYALTRFRVIKIQSLIRQYIAQKHYFIQLSKIKIIQKSVRKFLFITNQFKCTQAIKIQSQIRRFIAQKKYNQLLNLAILLQYYTRRFLRRKYAIVSAKNIPQSKLILAKPKTNIPQIRKQPAHILKNSLRFRSSTPNPSSNSIPKVCKKQKTLNATSHLPKIAVTSRYTLGLNENNIEEPLVSKCVYNSFISGGYTICRDQS